MRVARKARFGLLLIAVVGIIGFVIPERMVIPVSGATESDWNHDTFWYEPWGVSGVHKGIDVYASIGTPVVSATYGIVIYTGNIPTGGNVIAVLGPKWRVHYYAHLKDINVSIGSVVGRGKEIGSVGDTGNARGKPPHLHYTILTLAPHFWRWDGATQGWKKMFYLDPGEQILER